MYGFWPSGSHLTATLTAGRGKLGDGTERNTFRLISAKKLALLPIGEKPQPSATRKKMTIQRSPSTVARRNVLESSYMFRSLAPTGVPVEINKLLRSEGVAYSPMGTVINSISGVTILSFFRHSTFADMAEARQCVIPSRA